MAVADQAVNDHYALYWGDCFQVVPKFKEDSVHYAVFSPPFADLYCYSDDPADLGNCASYDQFFDQFSFLVEALAKVMLPGRIVSVHCVDIPAMKQRDGYIGLKDFPGGLIRCFESKGFVFHSRHIIWKDPLIEAVRTKSLGLMHKQLLKDSTRSRAGLPDQLLSFRAPGVNEIPVEHPGGLTKYAGANDPGGEGVKRSHNIWRAYASPIWSDIRQSRTLNATIARTEDDEKHLCPLQLDVIDRCLTLWSNEGENVLTPFMGVGSEVYGAVRAGRRGIGVELKESYYRQAERNVEAAVQEWMEGHDQRSLLEVSG